ncbi:MAG TPA: right-handed parallel beta-helix repeat-containing protein, partial [Planctomycetota bacterium]|nr:right-handed parallel beta-helix repeat-containing protein [Planctomycetota bacterium]
VDAETNWWGSMHGPADPLGTVEMPAGGDTTPVADMLNAQPAGVLGNAVSENVDYFPWTTGSPSGDFQIDVTSTPSGATVSGQATPWMDFSCTSVTLTAEAGTTSGGKSYHFVEWTGDASGSANPLTVTMDGDKAVNAAYEIDTWLLTVTSDPPGILSSFQMVDDNTPVTLIAPARTLSDGKIYNFSHWSTAQTDMQISVAITENTDLIAIYDVQHWTLIVNSTPVEGFDITGDKPGTTNYTAACDDQDLVSLTAPETAMVGQVNYRFVDWSTGATSQTISVSMTAARTVTANYIAAWKLDVKSTPITGVAITSDPTGFGGTTDYDRPALNGQTATLTAPQTKMVGEVQYNFVRWTGGSDGVLSTTQVMTGNATATAEYALPTSMPSVVYVDDDWTGKNLHDQVDVAGSTKVIGYNAFATIQGGVNGVAGSTVNVAPGTYPENIVINKPLELLGSGSGSNAAVDTIINGSGSTVVTFVAGGASAGDRVVVKDVRVVNGANGLRTDGNTDHITLDNVVVTGCSSYGFEIHNTADVDDLIMTDCSFNANGSIGMRVRGSLRGLVANGCHFDGSTGDSGSGIQSVNACGDGTVFTNVQFTDCTFNDNPLKGMYFEKLDNATFTNITVLNSGTAGAYASGIDVNVKYGTYENINFTNPTVTNCGTGNSASGTGIVVKGRNDGSYASCPASLSNVSISGGSVTGCPIGVSFGNNVSNISLSGGASITGTGIGAAVWTDPSSPAVDLGNTSFGDGLATYVGVGTAMNVTATSATFTGAADNFAIEDRVYHKLDDLALGLVTWVDHNVYVTEDSGSIQRGITAVVGSTVNVAAGNFTENLTIPAAKANLKLMGAGKTATFLSVTSGVAITTYAPITVKGFCISGPSRGTGTAIKIIN